MKIAKFLALVLAAMLLVLFVSCTKKIDITGYYSAEKLNNIYYFSPDGKIYENYSSESVSCYELSGDKLITYVEGEREYTEMTFDFELTNDGFLMGNLKYVRIFDPSDNTESEFENENS